MMWRLFHDLHFSTVLSCLYWDSVLLYLHVDSFSWSYLSSWTSLLRPDRHGHDRHYLITGMVAMAQRVCYSCYSSSPAITLLLLHVNFPNGINTRVSELILLGKG